MAPGVIRASNPLPCSFVVQTPGNCVDRVVCYVGPEKSILCENCFFFHVPVMVLTTSAAVSSTNLGSVLHLFASCVVCGTCCGVLRVCGVSFFSLNCRGPLLLFCFSIFFVCTCGI